MEGFGESGVIGLIGLVVGVGGSIFAFGRSLGGFKADLDRLKDDARRSDARDGTHEGRLENMARDVAELRSDSTHRNATIEELRADMKEVLRKLAKIVKGE